MSITQLRSQEQLRDNSINLNKLEDYFLQGQTWATSSDNSSKIANLSLPTDPNDAATKEYVDGVVDTVLKSPDSFITTASAEYPSDYKGSGGVNEGDSFYVTDVSAGQSVGSYTVQVGDMFVSKIDNPGNTDSNWIYLSSKREVATTSTNGIIRIATQSEVDAGTDTFATVSSATLSSKLANEAIGAGEGLVEDANKKFNIVAADNSITVDTDDIKVTIGTTNGTDLELTATGLELASVVTGARTFNGEFTVDSGANSVSLTSGGTLSLIATADNAVLGNQPTGTVDLAVATTKFVVDTVTSALGTTVTNELPLVTDGSSNVTLANTPASGVQVYLNGQRLAPGSSNDFTLTGNTISFTNPLVSSDVVLVDYLY